MRTIIFFLLLMICFLAGVLYATDHQATVKEPYLTNNTAVEIDEGMTDEKQDTGIEESLVEEKQDTVTEETVPVQKMDTPAFQAASALETVVSFFYEIIVDILYQVSKLFY